VQEIGDIRDKLSWSVSNSRYEELQAAESEADGLSHVTRKDFFHYTRYLSIHDDKYIARL